MRGEPAADVVHAIARCERPTLVFDLTQIETNLAGLATAAHAYRITTLFAVKSFPHRRVLELAAQHFDGFDVGSAGELAILPPARMISIADPAGRAALVAQAGAVARMVVVCETVDQVLAAPLRAEIGIRLSASLTARDPAIGAVLDGSGHRRSRFGLDLDPARRRQELIAMARAAAGRPLGLHLHHGPVTATSGERFAATARAALAVAEDAGISLQFLDLGGAWHGVADLDHAFAAVRAVVPSNLELRIEPGRVIADRAGFASGRVVVARELDDRQLRVLDLSRICHLRWSQVDLVAQAPHPGAGVATLWVGPTCFEEDVLGEWTVDPSLFPTGAQVIVGGVSGYALAWNTGFGGIPAADVVFA